VRALRGVDLDCAVGQIYAVLGENGAGKSTLMNVITGLLAPDAGEMTLDGQVYRPSSPQTAMRHGVGMVHQDFQLIGRLTVGENLFLGWVGAPKIATTQKVHEAASEAIARFGFDLDPSARVQDLSVGQQQRVVVVRALVRGAQVLILDEPTAALTPQEADELFVVMRSLASQGTTIIFITHKLREVMDVADHVTVLRLGERVASFPIDECDEARLAREMLGRDVVPLEREPDDGYEAARVMMHVEGICARDERGLLAVKDVSLDLSTHEIVGVAAVAGNGQRELSEVLTGVRTAESGRIEIDGIDLAGRPANEFTAAGIGFIPEDRLGAGMMLRESIARNAIMKALSMDSERSKLTWRSFIRPRKVANYANELLEEGQVSTRDSGAPVGHLSGGNIQRLLIAREVRVATRVLIAVHPTLGLDVGATERTWQTLLAARARGISILLVSEDLDEVLTLSDRILVMHNGVIVGQFQNRKAPPSREQLGLLMGGAGSRHGAPGAGE
jgi:simple sugar transport system ATP-binding protein